MVRKNLETWVYNHRSDAVFMIAADSRCMCIYHDQYSGKFDGRVFGEEMIFYRKKRTLFLVFGLLFLLYLPIFGWMVY